MKIEHYLGKQKVNNTNDLENIMRMRSSKGFNEFWISKDENYPALCVLTNEQYAYVHYFQDEGEPGYRVCSNEATELAEDETMTFWTNGETEEVFIENNTVIFIDKAIEIVKEFQNTGTLPSCVEWEEL